MLKRAFLIFAAGSAIVSAEPIRGGQASAEWIAGSTAYAAGKPIQTGIKVTIDDGWHTYWINPGEAGSKVAIEWNLPAGWKASDVSFPVPKRFLTGELPGYGYEHEVIFPVTITPPKGAEGLVELAANVSWLTCNNASCVPGKVELKLALGGEAAAANPAASEAITASEALVPKKAPGTKLIVRESGDLLNLSLTLPSSSKIDAPGSEVFPETLQAVDHYKPIRFQKTGPTWSASVKKNEYAEGPLKELKLVLAKKGTPPVEVVWTAQ